MKAVVYGYGSRHCKSCIEAKALLTERQIPFVFYPIDTDLEARAAMFSLKPDAATVPQIWIDDQYVGGFDDLQRKLNP